jgi:SM-20-related protein
VELRQSFFEATKVVNDESMNGILNPSYRRSKVLFDLGEFHSRFRFRLAPILARLPEVLGCQIANVATLEAQLTASGNGEFFRLHNDNSHANLSSRRITFVYYFYREPKRFTGGELKLYPTATVDSRVRPVGEPILIEPRQNRLVFFESHLMHEVATVSVETAEFMDSRFTLNGWIHAADRPPKDSMI